MMDGKLPDQAKALLDAWFGPPGDPERERHRDIWFKGTPEFDTSLRDAFLADYEAGAAGEDEDFGMHQRDMAQHKR